MPIISQTSRRYYTAYMCATTGYVYTANASTGANDGWIEGKADNVVIQIGCGTLSASKLHYRVEGRDPSINRPAEVHVSSFIAVTTRDRLITISEKMKEYRVGVKISAATPVATHNYVHAGIILTETR